MTARERILAATGGDVEHTEMVLDMIRRAREKRPQVFNPEPMFLCANCLREWAEPACDECGANLMPKKEGV